MPEPEERFAVDEYSDMVAVSKPTAYITVGELVNTHRVRGCNLGGAGQLGRAVEAHDGWRADPWQEGLAQTLRLFPASACHSCCWSTRTGSLPITGTPSTSSWRTLGSFPLSLTSSVGAGGRGRPAGRDGQAGEQGFVQPGMCARKLVTHSSSLSLCLGDGHRLRRREWEDGRETHTII